MLGMKTQLDHRRQEDRAGREIRPAGHLDGRSSPADDAPIIWRGPMLHGALQQFFREVAWSDLDYLIVDLPPGTGDVALSLSQTVPVAGAIVVTTPQQVSLADSAARRRDVQEAEHPAARHHREHELLRLRRTATTSRTSSATAAARRWRPTSACRSSAGIPIYQPIREGSDAGVPLMISEPESPSAQAFMAAAERTAAQVSIASYNRPTIQLTVVQMIARQPGMGASGSCARSGLAVRDWRRSRGAARPRAQACGTTPSAGGEMSRAVSIRT